VVIRSVIRVEKRTVRILVMTGEDPGTGTDLFKQRAEELDGGGRRHVRGLLIRKLSESNEVARNRFRDGKRCDPPTLPCQMTIVGMVMPSSVQQIVAFLPIIIPE
jgi:hypothetical protein